MDDNCSLILFAMHCRIDGEPHTGPHYSLFFKSAGYLLFRTPLRQSSNRSHPTDLGRETDLQGDATGTHEEDALPGRFPLLPVGLPPLAGLHDQAAIKERSTGRCYEIAVWRCATRRPYEERWLLPVEAAGGAKTQPPGSQGERSQLFGSGE